MHILHLGKTKYAETWELQKKIFSARMENKIDDVILLTEHEPVYTLGKAANENHLLANDEELQKKGIEVFHIDRGGDITFHGPGQFVGYPILDLSHYEKDSHKYLRKLEEVLIHTLREYNIEATRDTDYTGVWVGSEKIAAIGVKISRWFTMHGFALNVNTDLSYFDRIIPCGIFHKGVTSLQKILQKEISLQEVETHIIHHIKKIFSVEITPITKEQLLNHLL